MAQDRIAKLRAALKADGVEALVVTKGSDIKYLTGFTGEYGTSVLVLTDTEAHFVTDGRFEKQASDECAGTTVHIYQKWDARPANYYTCAGDIVAKLGVAKAAFVPSDLSYGDYADLTEHAEGVELTPVKDYAADIRAIKEPEEIELIKHACKISMASFYALLDVIEPGVTEIDVANELEYQFRSRCGSGFCFETIVASGPDNGACPHATASERVLEAGDFVTIDFGTYYKGYCSDITRTVVLGKAKEPKLYDIFKIVSEAKAAGAATLRPGVSYAEVSNAITGVVEAAGYKIPHGAGHNFGLDIHEAPYLSPRTETLEAPGMIHTIEPGIYLPGIGGVRQEDDYLITEDGYERLTYITDHLIEL